LQDAAQAIQLGKLDRAEVDLQSVLRAKTEDYRALDLLGIVRVLQKREAEAENLFSRAIQKQPNFAAAHAHLGQLYAQKGRTAVAVPQLREALRLDSARRDAADTLAPILQEQAREASSARDFFKALELLMEARKYAPDNPDVQFELGATELQMSLWPDAVEAFQRTLKLRENDALAVYDLGRAWMGLSEFEDARQQFAAYIKLRPDDASGYCALGMTLAALQDWDEAKKQFARSIALAPGQSESYFRLGLIELDAHDLDEAAKSFREVLAHEPKHAGALGALGRLAFEQRRYAEAIDLLKQAIAGDDSLREAHYYLGLALARAGRTEEANQQLDIATRLEHAEAEQRRTVVRIQNRSVTDIQ
jgi:tetratricopeptide (TPR) repeat protein